MNAPHEFICRDCGIHVVMFSEHMAANDQDYCAECLWLRSIDDPVEREKLREFLKRRD